MSEQPTMPESAQAAAVRDMLLNDKSRKKLDAKLDAIGVEYPHLSAGIEIVRKDKNKPPSARSGSAPHEKVDLTALI